MIDKGHRIILECVECGHMQLGWSCIDGTPCEKCKGYLNVLGPFEPKEWEARFQIAFENNVRYIKENQQLTDAIKTALYELERLERNLELPARGYVRNCFDSVVRTLKEGVQHGHT